MILTRDITRVISPAGLEITSATADPTATTASIAMASGTDRIYLGFHGKFASRYFQMGTVNSGAPTLLVEYWDGSAWQEVKDTIDETIGFQNSGFISWVNQDDWEKTTVSPIDDVELYYVRISSGAPFVVGATLQSCLNIYSDDLLLRRYYPELVSDSRYLPPGRTDFLEQHIAAKNRVVNKLKQRRVIDDESQIIDINEVSEAATHAVAEIILAPIKADDILINRARKAFEFELNDLVKNADQNKDGIISDAERSDDIAFGTVVRR